MLRAAQGEEAGPRIGPRKRDPGSAGPWVQIKGRQEAVRMMVQPAQWRAGRPLNLTLHGTRFLERRG